MPSGRDDARICRTEKSFQSENCVAADAIQSKPGSGPKFPVAGKNTGKNREMRLLKPGCMRAGDGFR
jgi:hypothetical protein